MRILLFGNTGQVGWESQRALAPLGEVIAYDYPQVDFTKVDQLRDLVRSVQPQVIVNAAAYTAVDKAEIEPDTAWMLNAIAPEILAEEAKTLGAVLVHYSTDYVFDGNAHSPYTHFAWGQA